MIKSNARRTRWVRVALGLVALLGLTELGLRVAGLGEFPTYLKDNHFGYIPKPNQAGRFLQRNEWVFNDRSMGVATPWQASDRTDILLVGNSIVLGGNAYNQSDKLAPLMQSQLRASCSVWPVAAGGWATVNSARYLQAHPDLIEKSDFFVWQFMTGQMDHASPWLGETRFPTSHPVWATGYVLRKFWSERSTPMNGTALEQPSEAGKNYDEFEGLIQKLAAKSQQSPRGIILAYPTLEQLRLARQSRDWLPDRQRLERLAKINDVLLLDLAALPGWTEGMYWDEVHLNPFGNVVLASVLSDIVTAQAPFLKCGKRP
jgi:hypothetical protein